MGEKMENVGDPIQIPQQSFGDDVYMTKNGYFLYSPVGKTKALLEVESVIYFFEYKGKTYNLTNIFGCTLTYTPNEQSKYETKFSFTYSVTMLQMYVGDVIAVGGLPTISILVNIDSKWKENDVPYEQLNNSKTVFWNRELLKNIYEKMRAEQSVMSFK